VFLILVIVLILLFIDSRSFADSAIFTARSSYASAVLGIVILSVTCVLCDETKEHTAKIRTVNLVAEHVDVVTMCSTTKFTVLIFAVFDV